MPDSTLALGYHNVSTLSSTNRHRAVGAVRVLDTAPTSREGTVAHCELDSHANTCVAGPNFQIDEYTGEHCNVTPYSTDYQPLKDIPIVNASTAYTDPDSGETSFLQLNQVLWYGHRLAMSLINPNQIRHSGLTVSNDPTNKTRAFGISGRVFFIPSQMTGTTVFFNSRAPTKWEYESCCTVELTFDTPWNPGEVNIARASSSIETTLEQQTFRNLCAMEKIPRCINQCSAECECG